MMKKELEALDKISDVMNVIGYLATQYRDKFENLS
jgi:hypothetical protein